MATTSFQLRQRDEELRVATISLPMVQTDITLDDAISRMKQAGRSGVVWRRTPSEFVMYKASDIVIAKSKSKRRVTKLSELLGQNIETPDITSIAGSTPEPFIQFENLSKSLKSTKSQFGLLGVWEEGEAKAFVFGSAVDLIAKMEPGPSDCYCEIGGEPGVRGKKCEMHGVLPKCDE
jgi:hypothetical protein